MKYIKSLTILCSVIFLNSCGGGGGGSSGSSSSSSPVINVGFLIDSYVSGIKYYRNGKYAGVTGANGEFNYHISDIITFKIGNINLGEVSSVSVDNKVTLQDICQVRRDWAGNQKVLNIATLLQSLDDDGNPNNGINITAQIQENLTAHIDIDDINYNTIQTIVLSTGKAVKTEAEVKGHLEDVMQDNGYTPINLNESSLPPQLNSQFTLPPRPGSV